MAAGCQLGLNAALTVNLPAGEFALVVEPWAPAEPGDGGVYTVNITCREGIGPAIRHEPKNRLALVSSFLFFFFFFFPPSFSPGAICKEGIDIVSHTASLCDCSFRVLRQLRRVRRRGSPWRRRNGGVQPNAAQRPPGLQPREHAGVPKPTWAAPLPGDHHLFDATRLGNAPRLGLSGRFRILYARFLKRLIVGPPCMRMATFGRKQSHHPMHNLPVPCLQVIGPIQRGYEHVSYHVKYGHRPFSEAA